MRKRESVKQGRAFSAEGKARHGFRVLIGLQVCEQQHSSLLDWQDPKGITGREIPSSENEPYSEGSNESVPCRGREQVAPLALFIRTFSLLVVWKMF